MAIVINKAAVRRALEAWFISARAGETLGARETAELSAHDAAAMSSDFFYDLLVKDEDASQYVEDQMMLRTGEALAAGTVVSVDAEDGMLYAIGTKDPLQIVLALDVPTDDVPTDAPSAESAPVDPQPEDEPMAGFFK